ncbi:hypothetical protein BH24ACT12_BH24ACT12_22700 [soil metagenome]
MGPDPRLPRRRSVVGQLRQVCAAVLVPEVDEGVLQLPHRRPDVPDVGVSPLGRIQAPHVVAADEADPVVHDQQLAMVPPGLADVEQQHPEPQHRVAQHVHRRREPQERPWHDQIGEPVVDDEHLDPALGRLHQRCLELPAHRVALDDEGLEQDPLLGTTDRGKHVGVEVLAVGVGRDHRVAHRRVGRRRPRETSAAGPDVLAPRVDAHQDNNHSGLGPQQTQQQPLDDGPR